MQGKATLMGHPIHPMLIPFPIAFFVGALVCDIISMFDSAPIWPTVSVVLIGFGIVGALIAALFGFIDFVTAPMAADAKKTATVHMLLNLVVVAIFAIAFLLRYDRPPSSAGYAVTAIGVVVLAIAGSLGGHLVFHHGVGVENEKVPRGPSSSSTSVKER